MTPLRTHPPCLIVLRGNSGSGKSTTAKALRKVLGRGVAWIEQDHFRRIVLREWDVAGGANIGLIDLNVRYALGNGYHVILEGILNAQRYGPMLEKLHQDHPNSFFYCFDLPFEETVKRHATRPQAQEFSPESMQAWYQPEDFLPFVQEKRFDRSWTLESIVQTILQDTGLQPNPDL